MATGERRTELDGVRGIAVLMVLIGHAFDAVQPLASVGVALFFTLSGYLITGLLRSEIARTGRINLHRFYMRRFSRLGPPLLLMVVIVGTLSDGGWRTLVPLAWLTNYAAMLTATSPMFTHTWSLAVEEQFYLVWPVALFVLMRRRDPTRTLVRTVILLIIWWGWLVLRGHLDYAYSALETAGIPILAGCLVGIVNVKAPRRTAAVALIMLLTLASALSVVDPVYLWRAAPILALPANALIVAGAADANWLAWRPLALSGLASYSVYLWHWPVSIEISGSLTPAGVTVGVVAGLIAYVVVERPLMAWRTRRSREAHMATKQRDEVLL